VQPNISEVDVNKPHVLHECIYYYLWTLDPFSVVAEYSPHFKGTIVASIDNAVDHPQHCDLLVVNQQIGKKVELVKFKSFVLCKFYLVVNNDLLD
jgi:hypothetical protein